MTTRMTAIAWVLTTALLAPVAGAADVQSAGAGVSVRRDGCGFVDAVRFRGREVVRNRAGFVGGSLSLVEAGRGSAASLFADGALTVLPAKIDTVRAAGKAIVVTGAYADATRRVPFTRTISLDAKAPTLAVREETDFTGLAANVAVAEHSLRAALVVARDPHVRMFAFGCAGRAELFRMDMNDINRGGKQLISAPRGHWPYWDLGGVLQLAGSYRVWKANHADTMAYPVSEGRGTPGWADYSEETWGVTVVVDSPASAAPWAVTIDARKGVLIVSPHPESQLPAPGKTLGKRTFAFRLALHETSWPTKYPCELPPNRYRALLKDLAAGRGGGKGQPWILYGPVGTDDIETIIVRERIQPSILLRTLYRGDAYRMQRRMKSIGIQTPRNQPMAQWEKHAKTYLEHVRKKGVPK